MKSRSSCEAVRSAARAAAAKAVFNCSSTRTITAVSAMLASPGLYSVCTSYKQSEVSGQARSASRERARQIVLQIRHILEPHRQADHAIGDPKPGAFLGADPHVGGGRG